MEIDTENAETKIVEPNENFDWILQFQKFFDEFILVTSGYYDLKNEPTDFEMNFLKEEVAIEIYSLETALVSALGGIIPARFRLPASIIEFFLNNRIHGEMIMRISKKQRKELEPKEFLFCISNNGKISNVYGATITQEKYLQKLAESISKNMVKTSSQALFDTVTVGVFSWIPFINSILSGVFTYEESRNIAGNARAFIDLKPIDATI